jgi:redox-regulated HSP33 family molecular chaperone
MIDNRNRNINQTMDGENLNMIHEGDMIRVECDYCKKQILLSELDKHENKCQT